MYPVKISIRRRLLGGRQMLFKLTGDTQGCDIVHLEGSFTTAAKDFAIAVGVKAGSGSVYKHYIFQKSFNIPITRATCKLRVLKKIVEPAIIAEDGSQLDYEKSSEDDTYNYYVLIMDTFKPFRVESKSAQFLNSGAAGQQVITDVQPVK
jgi:hypothetical protein